MINPNAIYENAGNAAGEQNGPDPGDPKPKINPGDAYLQQRKTASQNMASAGASFRVEGVTPSDQQKFFGETGIYDPRLTGQNIALEAGERQSFGNKIARRLVNLVPNVTADLVDMIGTAGALLTEWGDERDYRNGLNELADSIRDPAGQNYRRSNDTWAIGDPTWWIDHGFDTIEFAGAYALGGVGVAKGLGTIARGIGTAANLGAESMQWLNGAAQLGTSGLVSYAQGAQDGATVFKTVYDNQFQKALAAGQDPDQARQTAAHIAAQSAATTAQLSTLLTMGINAGAYAPMFRTQEALARDIIASRVAQAESSGLKGLATMVRGLNAADYADKLMHHRGIKGVLDEMWREGGEEVLQQFAQATGTDLGNQGKVRSFAEQFGELENLLDRSANSEGLLAFALGSAFGGLQHTLIHNVIPSRRVERLAPDGTPVPRVDADGEVMTDEDGNPVFEKRWITPRTYEKDFTQRAFDKVKDAVAYDFERHEQLRTDFLAAMKEGNPIRADEIRDELFNTGKLYAVKSGMTDPWKRTFEQIAGMTSQQAMEAGYATSPDDTTYQEKAREAIADIGHLQGVYSDLQRQYSMRYEENQGLQPLIDMVFAREADLYSTGKRIARYRAGLVEEEKREQGMARISDTNAFNEAIQQLLAKHNSAVEVGRQIDNDMSLLKDGDPRTVSRLLKKYRAIGFGEEFGAAALNDLVRKLLEKKQQLAAAVQLAETSILNMPDYQAWLAKNPEGSFDQYLQEANANSNLSAQNRFRRAQLEQAEAEFEIARQNLSDMTSEKNAARFMRKATEWVKSLQREAQAIEEQKATKLADMTKDKATLSRLERIGKNQIAEQYRSDRDMVYTRIYDNSQRIAEWQKELSGIRGDFSRSSALRRLIRNTIEENNRLGQRAMVLDSLFRTTQVPDEVNPEPQETEKVDGTIDGKDLESASEIPSTGTTSLEVDDPAVTGPTPEQVLAEIEGISPVVTGEYATIQDELEALRKQIEDASLIDAGTDPIAHFQELYKAAIPAIQKKLQVLVDGQLSGEMGHSLDALNPEVNAGMITGDKARALLLAARDYVEEVQRLLAAQNNRPDAETIVAPVTVQEVLVQPVSTPDTPVLETDPVITGTVPENPAYHAGFKIVDAALTGAASTIGYEEGTKRMKNGELAYVKVTKPDALIQPVTEEILRPDGLLPGHPLVYEVHWEYEGEKKITDQLSWDGEGNPREGTEKGVDYLDSNGNVKADASSIGNVPIRVRDGITGKHLFHIRKMDWINAKFPGTRDYRNVVESTEEDPDNIGTQRRLLYNLRKAIIDRYNTDRSATEGSISTIGKGTGRLILNHVVESKDPQNMNINSSVKPLLAWNRKNPEISLLPDESLQVVIIGEGGIPQAGKGYNFPGPLGIDPKNLVKGAVGAMVPAANGQFLYAPLLGMKLVEPGKPSPALESVVRAIELYILNDGTDPAITAEIDSLESSTNFNVGTAQGLRAFINQYYTYLQDFRDSALSPNANTGNRAEQFVFAVDVSAQGLADKTKQIKAGFTMRGDGVRYANLSNGRLSAEFRSMLEEGFAQRSRAVVFTDQSIGIRGINSRGFFYDAVYVPGKGWKHNQYDNYNQYVKSFSRTPVYGRNQLADGTYVYTANPQLPIDPPSSTVRPALVKPDTAITQVKPASKQQYEVDADLFDQLGNFSLARDYTPGTVNSLGTGSDNSIPLTVAALQEKYNFTPEAQRNGKTVLEVLEELTNRGHSYLSDGYNPFSRCL